MNKNMDMYIVNCEKLHNGQKLSSGGIRENGRLVSLFKDPTPYIPENPSPASSLFSAAGKEIRNILIHEIIFGFAAPCIRACVERARDTVVPFIAGKKPPIKETSDLFFDRKESKGNNRKDIHSANCANVIAFDSKGMTSRKDRKCQ